MHIAMNGWFWNQENTGSGQYLRHLLASLHQVAGDDLRVSLIMPPHHPRPQQLPDNVTPIPTGDKTHTSKFGKVWFEQRTVPRIAGEVGADLLHVPYWGAPLSSPVPIVVSVLDVIPKIMPEYALGFFNRLYTELVSTSARGANHVITISYTSQVDIEDYLDIPAERISVTYLAPDTAYHPQIGRERDEAVRQKYNLPERFVLYMGGFDRRKQVNQVLLAYTYVGEAEGDNIPLVIAGREPAWSEPLFPNMRRYAEQLNITDYVRWIGYVDEADKPSLYRLADVFVYPSEYEGFGLPPLEAMASGTPVVTSDAPIFDEVLGDGAYLTDDARRMAGAIIALLIQKPFHDAMVNQGLAQATRYRWRKTAQATLSVYEQLLGR